jgi:hypothetical protein
MEKIIIVLPQILFFMLLEEGFVSSSASEVFVDLAFLIPTCPKSDGSYLDCKL